MVDAQTYQRAITYLSQALLSLLGNPDLCEIRDARDEVVDEFRPVFSAEHLPQLSEAEFRSFLRLKKNRHWSGLSRSGRKMCADMLLLRKALATLLDERHPIEQRWDQAVPVVPGMGKAVASAMLQVTFPDRYGIWNTVSEKGLKLLGLWPQPKDRMSYRKVPAYPDRHIHDHWQCSQFASILDHDL